MKNFNLSFLFIALFTAGLSPIFEGCNTYKKEGWPQVNGPSGNFNPARYGCILVNDMAAARKVWMSDDHDLGYAKNTHRFLYPRAF
jgi:hypothetical protein